MSENQNLIKVKCEKCGSEFMAQDLSSLFDDGQNHYICDDCYNTIQSAPREA